jgi:hypothetical protein
MTESTNGDKQLVPRVDDEHKAAEVVPPIIVSLGKKKKKQIKSLKRGKGSAMNEVMDVVDQVQAYLGDDASNKVIVPVVIIYKKKQRRFSGWF